MKMTAWRIIDGAIILSIVFLFIAGKALGTNMTGIVDYTTGTLTVTSGTISARGSTGSEPQAAILMFDTSCPTGWTRQTQFDGAIPYGAAAYSATPGGSSTHQHSVGSHAHSTNTISFGSGGSHSHPKGSDAATSSDGSHSHTQPADGDVMSSPTGSYGACGGYGLTSSGGHGHTVTFNANTGSTSHSHSISSGGISADTDTLSSETSTPAYARLVFCKKN